MKKVILNKMVSGDFAKAVSHNTVMPQVRLAKAELRAELIKLAGKYGTDPMKDVQEMMAAFNQMTNGARTIQQNIQNQQEIFRQLLRN